MMTKRSYDWKRRGCFTRIRDGARLRHGQTASDVRVPMKKYGLLRPNARMARSSQNEPVLVYRTSGPWGDPGFKGALKRDCQCRVWAGCSSAVMWVYCRARIGCRRGGRVGNGRRSSPSRRTPLRASAGHPVTQLWYAAARVDHSRDGNFAAIRENMGWERVADTHSRANGSGDSSGLRRQHPGRAGGAASGSHHTGICSRRGGGGPGHHSGQH